MIYTSSQIQDVREDLFRRHREVSETIRRAMLALLTFALFCWLTLGSSDRSLIVGDETVKVPFVEVNLSFPAFLIVAPFLLIVLTVYLHVFFEERLRLEERLRRTAVRRIYDPEAIAGFREKIVNKGNDSGRVATLFNFDHPVARRLTDFIFYLLVPLTLGAITWKALTRIEWAVPMMAVMVTVTTTLANVQHMRSPNRVWSSRTVRCAYGALGVILFMSFSFFPPLTGGLQRPFNLYRADLQEAWLFGADLRNADLQFANLSRADLSRADLSGSSLSRADLSGADLSRATLIGANFVKATLIGATLSDANLSDAALSDATLSEVNLSDASLSGADLSHADLSGADLSRATLIGADFVKATLIGATLSDANLSDANLSNAILSDTTLIRANFVDAALSGATLNDATLSFAILIDATLSGANLGGANLVLADLNSADLSLADLSRTNFSDANLSDAALSDAILTGADLSYAILSYADLSGAILIDATLNDAILNGAKFCRTTMPDETECNRDCDGGGKCTWLEAQENR